MGWQVIASSVAGSSHSRHNIPCQDAFLFRSLANDLVAIAVADGAGSADFGGEGAKIATTAAIDFFARSSTEFVQSQRELVLGSLRSAHRAVVAAAEQAHVPNRSFACTCIVALATKLSVVVAQVGDGAVVVDDDAGLSALTVPPMSEYANETTFLTSEDWERAVQCVQQNIKVNHVVALTDGLQRLALQFPAGSPHEGFFRPLLNFASSRPTDGSAQLESFLNSRRVSERTDDDVTLVIASVLRQ